jgi:hypothetical protein
VNHRLHLARLASDIRRERAILAALAGPLIDPQTLDPSTLCVYCEHPLGAHQWPGQRCQFAGCSCYLFVAPKGERPMDTPLDDPFADMDEPPPPPDELEDLDEPPAPAEVTDPPKDDPDQETRPGYVTQPDIRGMAVSLETLSRPVGAPERVDRSEMHSHLVPFPAVLQGQPGVAITALEEPARRVAEIVEALEPALLPPPVVAQLEDLLQQAAGIVEITHQAAYVRACEVYADLQANEKGLELAVGPVKAFFHRPWKTVCNFLAKYQPRILAEKTRLSALAGAWDAEQQRLADEKAREEAAAVAAEQRRQLEEDAERARAAAAQTAIDQGPEAPAAQQMTHVAEILEHAATQVQTVVAPSLYTPPPTPTKSNSKKIAQIVDEDAFFKGLAERKIPRTYVTIEQAKLDRMACDHGEALEQMYPGIKVVDKHGIGAKGGRR